MSLITIHGWRVTGNRYRESGHYSLKSSLIIAYASTILLWWLPIFGPMISGYVSGRAAGNKWKGLLTTLIVSLTFGVISVILTYNLVKVPSYINSYFDSTLIYSVSRLSPYLGWLIISIKLVLTNFNLYLMEIPPNWAVLIAFGFMGGAMSELLTIDNERKSLLQSRNPKHKDEEAVKPKVVEYEPSDKPHPLIKKVFKQKDKEQIMPEPIEKNEADGDEYI